MSLALRGIGGLPAIDAPVAAGGAPELDAAARERLKALGYLE